MDKIKNLSKENNFSKISAFTKDKQDSSALNSSSLNKQKTK